jgi:hypothetical protein
MLSVTASDIIARRPCSNYPPERIRELLAGWERWTALDILDLKQVPAIDRLWVVLHKSLINEKTLRLLACQFAEQALLAERAAGREPDARSWDAVAVARRFADGLATEDELSVAWSAAWYVANPYSISFNQSAAQSAAQSAVQSADRSVVWSAAWFAAQSAVRSAAILGMVREALK